MTWGFSSYETRIRWIAALWAVLMTAWCMSPLPWMVRLIGALVWLAITVLLSLRFAWWRPRSDRNLPIFLSIDGVDDTPAEGAQATRILKRETLSTLVHHLIVAGYRFQTVSEACREPTRKSIVLTVDGGTRALYTNLFPLLQALKIKATCFVTDRGERDARFLKPLELKEMVRSGVIELGGTLDGVADLSNPDAVVEEMRSLRHWLAGVTGVLPAAFAYPHDQDVSALEPLVKAAGYQVALTEGHRARVTEHSAFHILRTPIPRTAKPWQAYLLATRGRYSVLNHKMRKLLGR